ncbi:cytochrome o ubiquinol oxidase subunit III [Massilia sp. CFBP9012]|uniref:cytochrome o ubiquinol oxidase subunit III n=1 Tax=Massilia sp. CFBP9012 TaxID=3096531 RepID=UPI002A6ACF03|nr:cytochrome o ubiquinol oxidase subunit III [Massilia sp. CFBP9012]MDY0975569.1 cytochrome o ubiquinol oxidase subunit III [Massilia sp. CFBP9012]
MSELKATVTGGSVADDVSGRYISRDHHPEQGTLLGFWLYLMSDCLIFASLFATYAVQGRSYAGGPTGAELFELPLIALNTAFLLVSSLTFGFAMIAAQAKNLAKTRMWLVATGILGLAFLCVEIYEFQHLIHMGAGPQRSGFLTAFFALVGTHGLHVTFGIIWLVTLFFQLGKHGLTPENFRRLSCLSLFWHFLDLIWIFVFTFVYLMGVLP